jgi:periplasmic divalent cation tolerance protein
MPTNALLVLTTLGTAADARAFIKSLVEDRLVACGTLLPGAASIYRWNGAVQEENEVVVLLKTDASKWDALAAAALDRHPYDVPELLAIPVEHGAPAYLSWLADEVAA